jgi:carboxymethylenebutenolidase
MSDRVKTRRPDGDGPFPVVVFFHHGPGFDEGSDEAVQMIADAGFYVAALDRYWRHEPWITFDMAKLRSPEEPNPERDRFMSVITGTTDEHVEDDVRALLAEFEQDPAARRDRMGCVGYCIGARSVIRTMATHPDGFVAGVGLHPSFCVTDEPNSPHESVPSIKGHLYVGIGAADQSSSPEQNKPLIDAVSELGDRGTVEIHDGADHGFAVPRSPSYHEAAATRSYDQALALFRKVLG